MKNLFVLFFSLLNTIPVFTFNQMEVKEKHTETITKEMSFDSNTDNIFMIENVFGNLKVEGYNGNTVKIEIEKVIEANNSSDLKKGIEEIQCGTYQNGQGMILFTDAPFVSFDKFSMDFKYNGKDKMKMGECNQGYNKMADYEFTMNYTVKVPRTVNVRLDNLAGNIDVESINGEVLKVQATSGLINLEDLSIENISIANMSGHITGENIDAENLIANSMSGHVKLYDIKTAATEATSMSGHVIATYAQNPTQDSKFKTMSGHVDITFQPGLNAKVSQRVGGNGNCTSDFMGKSGKIGSKISNKISTKTNKKSNCSSTCNGKNNGLKMGESLEYEIGNGGPDFIFSTMNGHVKLKEAVL